MKPLNIKMLTNKIKPPCSKCPYKLGLIETFVNPCPECKKNDFRVFQHFQNMLSVKKTNFKADGNK